MPVKGLVSVIVPFYNAQAFLEETIRSVFAQTWRHWELILIDDGSVDGGTPIALDYAARHPRRVRYIEHTGHRNRGVCSSRNLGIREARGEYVAILDADDFWLPRKLEAQMGLIQTHPEAGMVFGRSEYWYDWQKEKRDAARNHIPPVAPGGKLYPPLFLLRHSYPLGSFGAPCPSSLLLRREVVEAVNAFEESFDLSGRQLYEDQAFLAKVYLNYPILVSDACWDRYRIHAMSCTAIAERTGRTEEARQFYFNWLRTYLSTNGVSDARIWRSVERRTWRYRHPELFARAKQVRHSLRLLRSSLSGSRKPDSPDIDRRSIAL